MEFRHGEDAGLKPGATLGSSLVLGHGGGRDASRLGARENGAELAGGEGVQGAQAVFEFSGAQAALAKEAA